MYDDLNFAAIRKDSSSKNKTKCWLHCNALLKSFVHPIRFEVFFLSLLYFELFSLDVVRLLRVNCITAAFIDELMTRDKSNSVVPLVRRDTGRYHTDQSDFQHTEREFLLYEMYDFTLSSA